MRKIALEKIDMLFEAISKSMSLYLPVDQNEPHMQNGKRVKNGAMLLIQ